MTLTLTWTGDEHRHCPSPWSDLAKPYSNLNLLSFPSLLHWASPKLILLGMESCFLLAALFSLGFLLVSHILLPEAPQWPSPLLFPYMSVAPKTLLSLHRWSRPLCGVLTIHIPATPRSHALAQISELNPVHPAATRHLHRVSSMHLWLNICKSCLLPFTQIHSSF